MSHSNIFLPYKPENLVAGLNKMNLDLSKHPTANELVNLPYKSVVNLAGEMAEQYTKWKNTEAKELRKMEEDVGRLKAKSEELNKDKDRLRKKLDYTRQELDHTRQELDQTRKRLVNSQEEYMAIEKQLKQVQGDLLATQAQLDKRPTLSTSHEQKKMLDAQRLKLLDELRAVNKENASLRKQLANGSVASMANVASDLVANYKPCGIGPKKQFTGTNPSAFLPWKWAVNNKFCVDIAIFPTEEDKISYAFHQLDQPIFQQLDAWIAANSEGLTMEKFYQQIEHCMGIHMLTEQAEDKLHTVTMKSNKTVDEYYQQIFKLWEQAKTPEREKIRRFEITLKPSILHALIGQKHTKIMDVLDAAREIEYRKHQISTKFARNSAKPFQKSSGRTWEKGGNLSQASGNSSIGASSAASRASRSSSAAPKNNRKSVNTTSSSANPNAKFIPTATKPAGWVRTWYDSETNPRKLQDDKRATLLQQEKCWGCRGSGHCGSNECCPLINRRLNVTTARAVEVSDSENLEKA